MKRVTVALVVVGLMLAACSKSSTDEAGPCDLFPKKDAEALLDSTALESVPFDQVIAASPETTSASGRAQVAAVAKMSCVYARSAKDAASGPVVAYQAGVKGQFSSPEQFKKAFDHDGYEAFDGLGRAAIFHRSDSGDDQAVTVLEDDGGAFTVAVGHHPATTRQELTKVARQIHERL